MRKLLKSHKAWALCLIPIVTGLCFLWIGRDSRPIHHDESLHALYGLYYYFDPAKFFYKYDPMLHGPLLYHLMPWVYHFLDESLNAVRFLPALSFTLFPLGITFLLKEKLERRFLIPAALLLTSPGFLYWGNFLRHDSLVILLLLGTGFAFHSRFSKFSSIIFLTSIALQFCTKENSYIHLVFILAFTLFDYLVSKKEPLFKAVFKNEKWIIFIGLILSASIYSYYYSGGFNYSSGILDGLYRKSLAYWSNQHSIERLSGPFLTQFFVLLWYDLPILLILIFSVFKIHWSKGILLRLTPFLSLGLGGFFHLYFGSEVPNTSLWSSALKVKLGIDFYGFFFLLATSVTGTWILIKNNARINAFFYYWTFASFFTYSFLGEKVPWLSLYTLISGIIFIALYYKGLNKKILIPLFTFTVLFNGYQAYQLKFINAGNKTEFISQVHTSKAYQKLSIDLRILLDSNKGINVLALRDNTWPLSWFLYKRDGFSYFQAGRDFTEFDVVLEKWPSALKIKDYEVKKLPLRHWWLPDWKQITWGRALTYSFDHKPWNSPGEQYILVYYKKGLLNF
ncbi:MAG: hypothetical protein ACJAT2_000159 [Bacteriovoracaceae bacterium]|jgi:uncharacterized protein (TIGR03663 family)